MAQQYFKRENIGRKGFKKDKRPNVLLLMTDQQRHDTINAAGFDYIKTPNLDRLVNEGCLYRNAYSPNPICIPARHNLLTGLPARFHGFADNYFDKVIPYKLPTFPQILSDSGYVTHAIGKMHFFPRRRHNGYDRIESMEEVPRNREEDDYAMYLKEVGLGHIQNIHGVRNLLYMVPQRSLIPEEYHGTTWVADKAITFIKNNGGRQPFLLKVSWIAPHPPFDVPDNFAELYKDKNIPEPYLLDRHIPPLMEENKYLGDIPNEKYLRRMRELYYSAITHVDHNIGRILTVLEEIGEMDNTFIIFLSDHGELLGDYQAYQKWLPYDSCSRIPFIIRYPEKIKGGSTEIDFVDLNDVLPTILDVAGIDYPENIELPGESLLNEGIKKKNRYYQYMEYSEGPKRWISLRNKKYKYNYYYGGGFEEFFDLENDANEIHNLLERKPSNEILNQKEKLRNKLIQYEKKYGLEGYVKENDFIKLEPYNPDICRENLFPVFPEYIMNEDEKKQINNFFDELILAIEKEPMVNLSELDIKTWQKNNNIEEKIINKLLKKAAVFQKKNKK